MVSASSNNAIFNFFFWLKAWFALSLAFAGLGYGGYKVYDLREKAIKEMQKKSVVAETPDIPTVDNADPNAGFNAKSGIVAKARFAQSVAPKIVSTLAKLEPPTGIVYSGFGINWLDTTPSELSTQLGKTPVVVNVDVVLHHDRYNAYDEGLLLEEARELALVGGIMQLTVEPTSLAQLKDSTLEQLAKSCAAINSFYRVPVFLNFAHEFNGNWFTYGFQPIEFKQAFTKLALYVRQNTKLTAMVWSPASGLNYPFANTGNRTLNLSPTTAKLLDTNNNGQLDPDDDPYGPYWPGDEYVDWVGLSVYWNPSTSVVKNVIPTENYFKSQITASNFYSRFAVDKAKPMSITSTGAAYAFDMSTGSPVTGTIVSELDVKQAWWRQILNEESYTSFSQIKSIVFSETDEILKSNSRLAFSILDQEATRNAFLADIKAKPIVEHFAFKNNVKINEEGIVVGVN